MSEKFDKFIKALEELCIAHDVTLTVSEYDNLVVTDYDASLGAVYGGVIDDTSHA
jgi:hypothetical protein